jgi:hypothetical protein
LSINALKRVEVDRTTVTPNQKETKRLGVGENPFVASDDDDTENDGTLLEHLVKEITDVGWMICTWTQKFVTLWLLVVNLR